MTDGGWDVRVDSPLLPFVDGDSERVRFGVTPQLTAGPPKQVRRLLAGAAEVDLTPPPGMPKAGRSILNRDGSGFRGRLRARVLHLRSGTTSLLLVQSDLLAGSAVLQHLVARALAARADVPLAGILIGATHTHSGPANFVGSDFYNRHMGNRPGFDPAYTQFLVERIGDAALQAVATRRRAMLAVGRTEVWGLTRSRAHRAHIENDNVADKRRDPQRKFSAVNPWLHLIRVDAVAGDGGTEPMAAAIVFSVHATAVGERRHEYTPDVFGYLTQDLADRVERASGVRPVVGGMAGTHADVAPNVRPHHTVQIEAARIGREIGAAAYALWGRLEADLSDRVPLAAGLREVDLSHDRSIGDITIPRPALGAAQVAGAPENHTPVLYYLPPFRRNSPKPVGRRGEHGAKWVLFGRRLQRRWAGPQFPYVLPVQAWRIGDSVVVAIPQETTVEAGRRIERAVLDGLAGTPVSNVIVSSLANEYFGYVTTPEEYSRQFYEGGHTLHGPRTCAFVAAHAARLAAETVARGHVEDVQPERSFSLPARRFLARPDSVPVDRRFLGSARFGDATLDDDAFWELRWRDVAAGNLSWHQPMARVEYADGEGPWLPAYRDGFAVDDARFDIELSHAGRDRHGNHYTVRWWAPELRAGRRHRVVLLPNGGQPEVASAPFD